MFGSLILALALLSTPSPPRDQARLIPATSGACVAMSPDPVAGYTLTNICDQCRTALVSWCDGNAYPFDVPAHGSAHVGACRGFQMLMSDVPCAHQH